MFHVRRWVKQKLQLQEKFNKLSFNGQMQWNAPPPTGSSSSALCPPPYSPAPPYPGATYSFSADFHRPSGTGHLDENSELMEPMKNSPSPLPLIDEKPCFQSSTCYSTPKASPAAYEVRNLTSRWRKSLKFMLRWNRKFYRRPRTSRASDTTSPKRIATATTTAASENRTCVDSAAKLTLDLAHSKPISAHTVASVHIAALTAKRVSHKLPI